MSAAARMSKMLGLGMVSAFGSSGIIIVPLLVCAIFLLVSVASDSPAHARQQLSGAL